MYVHIWSRQIHARIDFLRVLPPLAVSAEMHARRRCTHQQLLYFFKARCPVPHTTQAPCKLGGTSRGLAAETETAPRPDFAARLPTTAHDMRTVKSRTAITAVRPAVRCLRCCVVYSRYRMGITCAQASSRRTIRRQVNRATPKLCLPTKRASRTAELPTHRQRDTTTPAAFS